jgi:hypothetical protein
MGTTRATKEGISRQGGRGPITLVLTTGMYGLSYIRVNQSFLPFESSASRYKDIECLRSHDSGQSHYSYAHVQKQHYSS